MDPIEFLRKSRDGWRRMVFSLERGRDCLRRKGDQYEIVIDDAGEMFMVLYGVHDFPIEVTPVKERRLVPFAIPIEGDVRMTRRPVRPS